MTSADRIPVYLEIGAKRIFAGAVEWPGWCRSGRGEAQAIDALLACAPRYASVVAPTGARFSPPASVEALEVVERLDGDATTDFGAPGKPPSADQRPMDEADLDRQFELLKACWAAFDAAAEAATGKELRKGPRGGGRDLPPIIEHLVGAELAYLNRLGARAPAESRGGPLPRRETILAVLAARVRGDPIPNPSRGEKRWSPRYLLRRTAWHALDHAWEIEDRSSG